MAVLTTPVLRRRAGIEVGQELPVFAWPGGYPWVYFVSDDSFSPNRIDGTLCGNCANDEEFGHIVFDCQVQEEDTDDTCDHCGCYLDNPTRDASVEADRHSRWVTEYGED